MQEFREKWEEWYGDLLNAYQWDELEYEGRRILYVRGNTRYTGDEGAFTSDFIQVIGCLDSGLALEEEAHEGITQLLRGQHGIDNICFWST